MSRSADSPNRTPRPEPCDALAPLLSPYADGAATLGESRRVEAHLIGCGSCRETLFWIQATHRTLAARPVALPPADLHSRIVRAIAASEAAPISLRPARIFALRPAYAAVASLTVLGAVLGYSLWHTPAHTAHPALTTAQVASKMPVIKTSPAALPHPRTVKTPHAQAAANISQDTPETVKPAAAVKRLAVKRVPAPRVILPPERMANAVNPPTLPRVAPLVVKTPPKAPLRDALDSPKIASGYVPAVIKPAPYLPSTVKVTQKAPPAVLTAKVPPAHTLEKVEVRIPPPTVERDPEVKPEVKVANLPHSGDGIMRGVIARVNQMHTVALLSVALDTTRQPSRGATATLQSLNAEHTGSYGIVYNDR